MPAATATWAIPYAISTDVFCDAYLTIQALAERVDAILDEFDFDEARTSVIPLAEIGFNGTQQVDDGTTQTNVIFSTVDFDSTDLADLSIDPSSVVIQDNQYSLSGAYCNWDSAALAAGEKYALSILYSSGATFAARQQRANGAAAGMHAAMTGMQLQSSVGDDRLVLEPSTIGTAGVVTATTARLWIMKMGDG